MTVPTVRQTVMVRNPQGFHMRPAAAFAGRAQKFPGEVWVSKKDERVDGKSLISLLTLGADEGSELTIEVSGDGAAAVLSALIEIVNTPFSDPE